MRWYTNAAASCGRRMAAQHRDVARTLCTLVMGALCFHGGARLGFVAPHGMAAGLGVVTWHSMRQRRSTSEVGSWDVIDSRGTTVSYKLE